MGEESGIASISAEKQLMERIAKILNETRTSYATHTRKLKELSALRSKFSSLSSSPSKAVSSSRRFAEVFVKTLTPLFHSAQRRTAAAERVVRFVAEFACMGCTSVDGSDCDELLEEFVKLLLVGAFAANRNARFRACQIISEIILRLPDSAEVSDELLDDVIDIMMQRLRDKVPVIRTFAVRALSRFVNDSENSDILDLLLEELPLEQNPEVRKTIVLSLPPSNSTTQAIIDCTLDVNESVRKAAYSVLANKVPLQSLSIKLRTTILQRGLADRSVNVSKECLKLMKDQWLSNCCQGDPIELLKYLDVETYEAVAELVMDALLSEGLIKLHDDESMRQYISFETCEAGVETTCSRPSIRLMEPEISLYWRTISRHLHKNAQAKGSDAAVAMGAQAAVYASEASDINDLLDRILPATVSDYVDIVRAHIDAGPDHHFASRQLLLLGTLLDFSDATFRKTASSFVQELLRRPLEQELDEDGNQIVIGDGINLGGDKDWADAVSKLVKKVHAAPGELEEVILGVLEELARPFRERTADFMQWMHTLSVTSLLLENAKSLRSLQGKGIEPEEILHALLLPGAKHVHLDVQRIAIKCLGLFGLLENKPSEALVKQLRVAFSRSPPPIGIMACKALVDLGMWHYPQEVDKAMGQDLSSQLKNDNNIDFVPIDLSNPDEDLNIKLLDLLYAGLESDDWRIFIDDESVKTTVGEGFAKFLLLGEKYPDLPASFHPFVLAKLIALYFSEESTGQLRFKQCLSVFFDHYASLSAKHKGYLSKAFIPVMRSMWPGIDGNPGGSPFVISNKRKRAVQASRFMLQMMQAPLYTTETRVEPENRSSISSETPNDSMQLPLECGEEGLAVRIGSEITSFQAKKTPAEKAYVTALCKILVLLHFRSSEQNTIKLMRKLLSRVADSIGWEKDILKEVKLLAEHLKSLDVCPEEELSQDQANSIFDTLAVKFNLDMIVSAEVPQTPAPCSTRQVRTRRRVRREETSSDEEEASPVSVQSAAPSVHCTTMTRSHRASKAAALARMTASKAKTTINAGNDDNEEEGFSSEVTAEDTDESDEYRE
ncbi:PREDICTED: condensin complex subunit 3 [Tarenaya hassleriana]|uniref:condensin complex subunit 3 n=1 Tax=Tarenaya hassleriana TaxID=28532 RepID=UPI00053CA272|nr:PREDICTED: condensin complex subunit 3 [Tarenaya hassleriana]XP_010528559.1 PREDICTED: condensin complex subunit 3 [Tarenaya hassleriana]